jgi:hypothetical protein
MEPETSLPKSAPERVPEGYGQAIERAPQYTSPETGIETGAERREQASEAAAGAADSSGLPTVLPPLVASPTAPIAPVTDDSSISVTPLVAGDDDLIEKEWVDRAKKIVSDTKEDPYKREAAVSKLQKDYQKKRYGRELGEA